MPGCVARLSWRTSGNEGPLLLSGCRDAVGEPGPAGLRSTVGSCPVPTIPFSTICFA